MNTLKFAALFIGGLAVTISACCLTLLATMFYGPHLITLAAFVLSVAMYCTGFRMMRTAERF